MSIATRDRLETMASGFMEARVLLSAVELDLFTALGNEELTAEEAAKKARTDPKTTERLLNALAGLHLVTKRKGKFKNSALAATHLTADSPEQLRHIMLHRANLWHSWSNLTEIVKKGKAPRRSRTGKQEESFIRGMADVGVVSAAATARLLAKELQCARKLLDVGGGPAVYACEFARRSPALEVTVLDLPGPLKIARETIRAQGLETRVKTQAADVLKAKSFGKDFDIVFLSNLIHAFKQDSAERVVLKSAEALKPGGHIIIKDFFPQRDGTAPTFTALFSINMLTANAGDVYSRSDVENWLHAAGVKPAGFVPVAKASALLLGVKVS